MKLSVNTKLFGKYLGIVSSAAMSRPTLPILANVHLECKDNNALYLRCTDMNTQIDAHFKCRTFEAGAITVPASLLTLTVKTMVGDVIEIESTEKKLKLVCDSAKANLPIMPALEFPMSKVPDGAEYTAIQPEVIAASMRRVVFAASTDNSRPTLATLCMNAAENELTLQATDGYRLSVEKLPALNDVNRKMLIPVEDANQVAKILSMGDTAGIWHSDNAVSFSVSADDAEVAITSSLVDGSYPDIKNIIPGDGPTTVHIDAHNLLQAVKFVSPHTDNRAATIDVSSVVVVSAGDAQQTVDAKIIGPPIAIKFDAKFLSDVLSNITGPVRIDLSQDTRPGLLRQGDNWLHVIMPMQPNRK